MQEEVLRKKGTEPAFSGKLLYNKDKGTYKCGYCGQDIFESKKKFDSGTGWPSFYDAIPGAVKFKLDLSHIIPQKEVVCSKCGSHLGHVYSDAPQTPTGKRFCINSCALDFKKNKKKK